MAIGRRRLGLSHRCFTIRPNDDHGAGKDPHRQRAHIDIDIGFGVPARDRVFGWVFVGACASIIVRFVPPHAQMCIALAPFIALA